MTLSIFSIKAKLRQKVWKKSSTESSNSLCLLIPLYKEDVASVVKTFSSLAKQEYPPNLVSIIIVVERDDDPTQKIVQNQLPVLAEAGFKVTVIVKPPPRSTKASALNYVLPLVKEPVIGVYDGGDVILDKQQLHRAVSLLYSGCDGVGVKVIRGGKGATSLFSWVDTNMWCDVTLPAVSLLLESPLLSGEGLFLRREALASIGGFPDSLTEDAHLTLLFAQQGLKMFLLDSTIYEGAPRDLSVLFRQKLRWHKGNFLCLRKTLTSRLPVKRKAALAISYSAPLVLVAIALSFIILVLYMFIPNIIPEFLFYWSLLVALTTFTAPFYLSMEKYAVSLSTTILLPIYWFLIGLLTLYALICPRISWYKTLRRADFNPPT